MKNCVASGDYLAGYRSGPSYCPLMAGSLIMMPSSGIVCGGCASSEDSLGRNLPSGVRYRMPLLISDSWNAC